MSFKPQLSAQSARSIGRLPFLYDTRTILRPSTLLESRWFSSRPILQSQRSRPGLWPGYKQTSSNDENDNGVNKAFPADDAYEYGKARLTPPSRNPSKEVEAPEVRAKSTITAAEQEIFDQIFRDIARSAPTTLSKLPRQSDKISSISGNGKADIETIFASALSPEELKPRRRKPRRDPIQTEVALSRYPPSLREAAQEATNFFHSHTIQKDSGSEEIGDISADMEEGSEREQDNNMAFLIERAVKMERETIERELKMAAEEQGDIGLWKVLRTRVFNMPQILDLDGEHRDTGSKAPRNGKPANSKPSNSSSATTETRFSFQSELISSPHLATVPPLALVAPLYPSLILLALRLYRTHFPLSPLALHILPTLKASGPTSYVLGATTAFYNELMALRFHAYSDLKGIDDLLSEMQANGVSFDWGTWGIIGLMRRGRAEVMQLNSDSPDPRNPGWEDRMNPDKPEDLKISKERTAGQAWWEMKGTRRTFWKICNTRYGWAHTIGKELEAENADREPVHSDAESAQVGRRAQDVSLGKGDTEEGTDELGITFSERNPFSATTLERAVNV